MGCERPSGSRSRSGDQRTVHHVLAPGRPPASHVLPGTLSSRGIVAEGHRAGGTGFGRLRLGTRSPGAAGGRQRPCQRASAARPAAHADGLEAAADLGRSQAGPGWTLEGPSGPELPSRGAGNGTASHVAVGGRSTNLGLCPLIGERCTVTPASRWGREGQTSSLGKGIRRAWRAQSPGSRQVRDLRWDWEQGSVWRTWMAPALWFRHPEAVGLGGCWPQFVRVSHL